MKSMLHVLTRVGLCTALLSAGLSGIAEAITCPTRPKIKVTVSVGDGSTPLPGERVSIFVRSPQLNPDLNLMGGPMTGSETTFEGIAFTADMTGTFYAVDNGGNYFTTPLTGSVACTADTPSKCGECTVQDADLKLYANSGG